jgi:hypothetical protein
VNDQQSNLLTPFPGLIFNFVDINTNVDESAYCDTISWPKNRGSTNSVRTE